MDGVLFIWSKLMKKTPVKGKSRCVLSLSRHTKSPHVKKKNNFESMKWISYLLTLLKVLINFGLMMKYEWLTFYSRFLATETVHIPQLKSNSAAVLQFRNQKNLIVQISLSFSYKIRFWWFNYHWKDLNKIYTMRNLSLEFEMANNEINCWKEATFNLGTNFKAGINSFDFSFENLFH